MGDASVTPSDHGGRYRDRLLAALLGEHRRGEIVLVGHQEPVAVLEIPDEGIGIVVFDGRDAPQEALENALIRIVSAHQAGVLFLVLVGGGPEARAVLEAADRKARDPNQLGLYHLDGSGRILRVRGRHLRLLDSAGRALASVSPLEPSTFPAIIERGRREREEALRFAASLRGRFHFATLAIAGVCVSLFALATRWGGDGFSLAVLLMGANSGPLVRAGEVWRLLSSVFLHGSLIHLVVNLVALISFGGFLETLLGWRRYLLLFGASGLAGSLASALLGNVTLSVGASGAVWGLMAAGLGLVVRRQGLVPQRIAGPMRQRLLFVTVINGLFSFVPGIDFFAHFGGGAVGFLLAATGILSLGSRPTKADAPAAPSTPSHEPLAVRVGAIVVALLLAVSIGTALVRGRPWDLRQNPSAMLLG